MEENLQENIQEQLKEDANKDPSSEINKENLDASKDKNKIKNQKEKIKKLEAELEEVKNEMLKDRAELINFKRRTEEERIKDRKYANQSFAGDLIEVIDIFDKVVSMKTDDEKLKKYLMGFQMINMQLNQVMEQYGVKKIEALNKPFDEKLHEAEETVEREGVQSGIVVEVVREGYTFKDRILRPSVVKVSK